MSKKVILFNPHSTSKGKEPLPISVLQLAAQLPQGTPWMLVDGNYSADPVAEIRGHVTDATASLLAVTVMPGPQLAQATVTCKALKRVFPELRIIWGGYFPTQHYRLVLESGYVDDVAHGPADESFPEYVSAWLAGDDTPITGIVNKNRIPSGTPAKRGFKDPAMIPDLPYDRVDMERYINRNYLGERCVGYHSSDGCPFFCSFCAVVAMADGKWKSQSAQRVAANLFALQDRHGIDAVQFFDNNFFVSQKRCLEFADRILAANRRLTWWGEGRIDTLLHFQTETLEKMARSGLKMVFMGAETSNPETMALYKKGGNLTPDMTLALAEKFRAVGIVPEFSFVLGHPNDAPDQIYKDFEYIWRIKRINPASEIILYLYTPVVLPGKLYDSALDAGFRYPESLDGFISQEWQMVEKRKSTRLPWGKRTKHSLIHEFETVLNAYFPTVTDTKLRGWQRGLLQAMSSWRYRLKIYRSPLELRALHKLFRYMRPEVEGF